MTAAVFKGFDVTALVNAALALSVGNQKAKYSSDVAAQLGANPIFEIQVGGTAVYRSTVSGSLAGDSSGITIPSQFVEPPTVNAANALTDSSAVVVIRNASNASIEIRIPVKAGGATGFATASEALDGTDPVRTSSLILRAPSILDVSLGGGDFLPAANPALSMAQGYIESMTMVNQGQSVNHSSAHWTGSPGQVTVGSYAALQYLCTEGGDILTQGTGLNAQTFWNWMDISTGHSNTNNELQCLGMEAWILKGTGNSSQGILTIGDWEQMWSAPLGTGYEWGSNGGNDIRGDSSITNRDDRGTGIRAVSQNIVNLAQENWPDPNGGGAGPTTNASLMQQSVCWHCRSFFRVGMVNLTGTDNRGNGRYRIKLGHDLFNTSHPNWAGRGTANTGNPYEIPYPPTSRHPIGTMPGYGMNGSTCSWNLIPFNAANPDAWYVVSLTTFTPGFYASAGYYPAVAAAFGADEWAEAPFGKEPYAITHGTFLGKLPPDPA